MFVLVSITGVAVTPIDGVRSAQPMSAGFHGVPRFSGFDHCSAPVAGFRPYTSFFSVATSSVPLASSGCA